MAGVKNNHERLKVLEEENENLRELIKRILVKVGEGLVGTLNTGGTKQL